MAKHKLEIDGEIYILQPKTEIRQKIKSVAECGMQPTYYFEVGQLYPFPKGKTVTEIMLIKDENEKTVHVYNEDGLLAEMINCPVSLVYFQGDEPQ